MSEQSSKLSQEDQIRVKRYLASSNNGDEARSFRPWRLLGVIWLVLLAMSGASYWIAKSHGVL